MLDFYQGKHFLKQIRWRVRRAAVAARYGPVVLKRSPMIFGNAMPKSGSHLLTQILEGLIALGPFVNPGFPPVNRDEGNHPLSQKAVLRNILAMRPGDIRYGYVHATEPFISILTQPGYAAIFMYRDPRDMLVSHIYYARDMHPGHGMHQYYTEKLTTMEEQLNAAISGVTEPGFELASVRQRYESYLGWLDQAEVLCLKFEDLILNRDLILELLLNHLEARGVELTYSRSQAVSLLKGSIAPEKSGTFRKGIPGDWRTHFSEANKAVFNQVAGDLLVRLGYEVDDTW